MHRATETLMRIALSCACAFGLLVAAIAVPALRLGEATPAWAQSGEIDPTHPFAGIASSQQWEKLFIPGTPNIVPMVS